MSTAARGRRSATIFTGVSGAISALPVVFPRPRRLTGRDFGTDRSAFAPEPGAGDVYDGAVSEGGIVDWASFGAVLFDLDGVVTPTADIHEKAWAELFAPWGFDSNDYLTYVDGRPRYEGVLSRAERLELQQLLERRGFEVGEPDGRLGLKTRDALRDFRARIGHVPDGFASAGVLERLRGR